MNASTDNVPGVTTIESFDDVFDAALRPTDGRLSQQWDNQQLFLKAYARCGNATAACLAIGMTYDSYYRWNKQGLPEWENGLARAEATFADNLESLIMARIENPVGNRGSDPLAMFMMKALRPEKYREAFPDVKAEEQAKVLWTEMKRRAQADKPAA
jgi:hypothetical protein